MNDLEAYDHHIRHETAKRDALADMIDYLTEKALEHQGLIDHYTQLRDEALGNLALGNVVPITPTTHMK
jgi:hypothetical protein